ncbi:MAG: Eco57I restriction-modification methylase domain-containing protein, partial [Sulfurimonas sp.]|nr:Eco57I restriction-modification methylase domain-containing protein [Sulfurimonas sp.]
FLNEDATRTKGEKGHPEITLEVWKKIFKKEYEVVAINFGSNKDIKIEKSYKYPTILKYIKIDNKFFTLAFLPNIWGDLELNTIFPIREKNIKSRLKKFDKSLNLINKENFAFNENVYKEIEKLREDCRSLHAEPLQNGAELPRQAVIQKGLSTFRNFFNIQSITSISLMELLRYKDYYNISINKLLNNSKIPQTKLKDIMNHRLKSIKVIDPAIGSGAFPMGMLHEIINTRVHLGDKTPLPVLKREIIENSIYGVDIEQSAVEIAKLRFWLSIVVDEEKPIPLPNLFYKIMVGNSLVETINGFDPLAKDTNSLFDNDEFIIDAMQDKLHNYFKESDIDKKNKLQESIEETIDEVLGTKLQKHEDEIKSQVNNISITDFDNKQYKLIMQLNEEIKTIEKVLKRPTTELFFYKLYFKEVMDEGGFDVVIGNPPYVRQEKIKELKSKKEIQNFKSYCGTADLYIYFFEKGYNLLKENGILSYITSNKYTRAKYGKDFRNFLLENTEILNYIDFHNVKIFKSATTDTSILSFKKSTKKNNSFVYCDIDNSYKKNTELEKFISKKGFEYQQNDLQGDSFSFANPEELKIKKKIEKIGTPLKEWDIDINRGILTGFNEAFVIDGKTKDELIKQDSKSAEIIKPLLRGRDIKRYKYEFADKWLINSHNNPPIDINKYPAIKEHLDKYYMKLEKRSDKGATPYNLRNCAFLDDFEKEKIVWLELSDKNKFTIENKFYPLAGAFLMNGKNLKYLLAFLNSKVIGWHFPFICNSSGVGTNQWKKVFVENLCIPQIPKEQQKPFEILVDYILFAKENDMDEEASLFESIIDGMVYDLYFVEDMKKADCFISDEVNSVIKEFDESLD